jgi:hypothetical protein
MLRSKVYCVTPKAVYKWRILTKNIVYLFVFFCFCALFCFLRQSVKCLFFRGF